MDIQTLLFALAIALAFGAVWWGTTRLALNAFLIPFLSALAALAVFFSHSLLGVKV
jgi:hypothetical protein